jgi:hypothetical protein
LGGNQNDRVARSHYRWDRVYGFVRPLDVTSKLPPVRPKPPLFEIVVGDGEDAKVVATGNRFNIAKRLRTKAVFWQQKHGGFTVRRKKS